MSLIDKEKQWKLYNKMMNEACGKEEAELIRQKLISLKFKANECEINNFDNKEQIYKKQIVQLKKELANSSLENVKYITENGILKIEIKSLKSKKEGYTIINLTAISIIVLSIISLIIK